MLDRAYGRVVLEQEKKGLRWTDHRPDPTGTTHHMDWGVKQ